MIGISNHSEVFLWYKLKLQCAKDAHNGAGAEKAGFAGWCAPCSLYQFFVRRRCLYHGFFAGQGPAERPVDSRRVCGG